MVAAAAAAADAAPVAAAAAAEAAPAPALAAAAEACRSCREPACAACHSAMAAPETPARLTTVSGKPLPGTYGTDEIHGYECSQEMQTAASSKTPSINATCRMRRGIWNQECVRVFRWSPSFDFRMHKGMWHQKDRWHLKMGQLADRCGPECHPHYSYT